MIDWTYRNLKVIEISDFSNKAFGFIYEITFNNGKKYLGSKYLYHKRTLKPLKGKKRKRKKVVESDWKTYVGSIKDVNVRTQIKNGTLYPIKRVILKVCYIAKQVSYYETKYLFLRSCLEKDDYYNSNILGKFYKKDT